MKFIKFTIRSGAVGVYFNDIHIKISLRSINYTKLVSYNKPIPYQDRSIELLENSTSEVIQYKPCAPSHQGTNIKTTIIERQAMRFTKELSPEEIEFVDMSLSGMRPSVCEYLSHVGYRETGILSVRN
ncbi:hypothetical protein B1J92_A00649g [Nakaseomyces glabratus]|nr:hypothetical protein B1J91_A00649g [Nakaseomyces glabratus]OXB50595.1 hypothetical protein B1J92_A00649g [Nakaseomyces glabratus]